MLEQMPTDERIFPLICEGEGGGDGGGEDSSGESDPGDSSEDDSGPDSDDYSAESGPDD